MILFSEEAFVCAFSEVSNSVAHMSHIPAGLNDEQPFTILPTKKTLNISYIPLRSMRQIILTPVTDSTTVSKLGVRRSVQSYMWYCLAYKYKLYTECASSLK